MTSHGWLAWVREIQAIAQTGLAYTDGPFDRERYQRLQALGAEMAAELSDGEPEPIRRRLALEPGYPTPKVDVRAACFSDDRLLLVRERSDGRWSLPGGWADMNQSPAQCAVREVKEESGFDVAVVKLAAVLDLDRHPPGNDNLFSIYKIYFVCRVTGGAARASSETSAVGFFDPDDLPPLSEQRVLPHMIPRLLAHWREPGLAAEFD